MYYYLLVYLEPDVFLKSVFLTDLLRKKKEKQHLKKRKRCHTEQFCREANLGWPSGFPSCSRVLLAGAFFHCYFCQFHRLHVCETNMKMPVPRKTATWNPGEQLSCGLCSVHVTLESAPLCRVSRLRVSLSLFRSSRIQSSTFPAALQYCCERLLYSI